MSGRGKGGKGLGKGGAKRHRKVLRDNIQGEKCLWTSTYKVHISSSRPTPIFYKKYITSLLTHRYQ